MNALTIGNSAIRIVDSLYSLNDLHKAAGNEEKHQPAKFMRLDQTKSLISEIAKSPDVANSTKTLRGSQCGTYACKELVYAYAMWISAAFMLQVIRAYDAIVNVPDVALLPNIITKQQAHQIHEGVLRLAERRRITYQAAWRSLYNHIGRGEYKTYTPTEFDECIKWLEGYAPQASPSVASLPTLEQTVKQLAVQLVQPNSYPLDPFMPLWHAMNKRINHGGKILVAREKLSDIYTDLGKLRERIDGFSMIESDLPPSWWQSQRIAA